MKGQKVIYTLLLSGILAGCNEGDDNGDENTLEIPSTYAFTREGESTVDFSGQTDRLDMLSEMKAYLQKGDGGELIEAQTLLDMFNNENSPFENADLNVSTKKLKDKTLLSDVPFFEGLFQEAGEASASYVEDHTEAGDGVPGRLQRGTSENYILVNGKGWEFTQMTEKGLMGAVFLHQVFNTYLTDERIGDDVENTELEDGKNYTPMEHHWDEAFGYWGVPVDFPAELPDGSRRFWANYSYGREALLGVATNLKNAFLTGRTAIVNKDYETKDAQTLIIYENFELTAAATAIHYLNESIADLNTNPNDVGTLFHHLSEGYGFVRALRYSPYSAISLAEVDEILNEQFGENGNFWTVELQDLQTAKATLVSRYPELADLADDL